jgi:tetratricopeptide (TPR) repeat protein
MLLAAGLTTDRRRRPGTWSVVLLVLAAAFSACGRGVVVVPTAGTPHYPDFVEPAVPLPFASTPASNAQARAWQFLQAGDLRNAEREANVALKAAPDFYPATTTLAYLDLARRDARASIVKFDRALAREPGYSPALAGKGQALASLNRDDEAVAAFEAALRSNPSLNDVARRLDVVRLRLAQRSIADARQAARAGRYDEAMGLYRAALERSPESAFLYRELALIERDHDNGEAAIEHFRRAAALDPTDRSSLLDLAAMLDARNDFDGALKVYDDALAIEPDAEVAAKRDALRLRAEVSRLPAEYRSIEGAPQITRGDLAALIGFRLQPVIAGMRPRDVGVITDIRGHWAERWILEVARAGILDAFENHTFQPRAVVRRVDFAQAVSRLLNRVATLAPNEAARWRNARGSFPDVAASNVGYTAVSAAVASGVMMTAADGTFRPAAPISGTEATDALVRILGLSGMSVRQP